MVKLSFDSVLQNHPNQNIGLKDIVLSTVLAMPIYIILLKFVIWNQQN